MSGQLDNGEVSASDRPLDLVEADTDRCGRRRGGRGLRGRHRRLGRQLDTSTPACRCALLTTGARQASIHNKLGSSVLHRGRPADRSLPAGRPPPTHRTPPPPNSSFARSLHFLVPPFSVAAAAAASLSSNDRRSRTRDAPAHDVIPRNKPGQNGGEPARTPGNIWRASG